MKIVKSSFFKPKKCKYGRFELIPEDGWKISDTFIDFESKLLIVSTSILDKSKWIDNKYSYSIPSKEYKINILTLEILDFEGWRKFFNYEKQEILSDDGKLKLISKRSYDEERDSDGIKEELFEVGKNVPIATSDSVAFCERKRDNLLDDHYNRIKELEEYKKSLDEKLNLNQFYQKYLTKLINNKSIIGYYDTQNTFKLDFKRGKFILTQSNNVPYSNNEKFVFFEIQEFEILEDFWFYLTSSEDWYKKYTLYWDLTEQPYVLSKFIFNAFNRIRESHNFTFSDYEFINDWQRKFWSEEFKPTEVKQWCSNCKKEISYFGRYPKSICSKCYSKDKYSKKGELLEFYNLSISGGLKIVYKNEKGEILREDDSQSNCICIIDNKEFFAQEARFGGIVIQKK